MPLPRPSEWAAWAFENAQPDPLIWLIEVRSPSDGPIVGLDGTQSIGRVTPNRTPVVFGVGEDGQPLTWDPLGMEFEGFSLDDSGSVQELNLTVSNGAAKFMRVADANAFFQDCRIRMHLVHGGALSDPNQSQTYLATVTDWSASWQSYTAVLSGFDLAEFSSPKQLITPDFCRWRYRGPGCFYIGDLPSCAKTLEDCEAHGADELENSLPVIHPRQFGGFPGVGRGSLRAAGG